MDLIWLDYISLEYLESANGLSEQENEGCELKQSKVRISQPALWAIGWFHKAST